MRKLFVLMSLLVLASMLLAACGGAAPTSAPAEEPAATDAPAEPAATDAPAEPAATGPKSADPTVLNVADADISIDTLDPALAYDTASGKSSRTPMIPWCSMMAKPPTSSFPGLQSPRKTPRMARPGPSRSARVSSSTTAMT